jgi:hypothetical protein
MGRCSSGEAQLRRVGQGRRWRPGAARVVFGWQFSRESRAFANAGSASVAFTAPAVGRWRAKASYAGSRTASPSAVICSSPERAGRAPGVCDSERYHGP